MTTTPRRTRPEYWAEEFPNRAAIVDGDRVVTYAEWNRLADEFADALEKLVPGADRVCVMTTIRPEWFIVNLALAKLCWEHVAITCRGSVEDQSAAVRQIDGSVVITDGADPKALLRALDAAPGAPRVTVIAIGDQAPGTVEFASLFGGQVQRPRISPA